VVTSRSSQCRARRRRSTTPGRRYSSCFHWSADRKPEPRRRRIFLRRAVQPHRGRRPGQPPRRRRLRRRCTGRPAITHPIGTPRRAHSCNDGDSMSNGAIYGGQPTGSPPCRRSSCSAFKYLAPTAYGASRESRKHTGRPRLRRRRSPDPRAAVPAHAKRNGAVFERFAGTRSSTGLPAK
jgi:hypothetical protein